MFAGKHTLLNSGKFSLQSGITQLFSGNKCTSYVTILDKKGWDFALSYPQNAYPADLVLLWPLPSPHPGQICLFGIRNDPAGLQQCFFFFFFFFGGGGGGGRIEYL